MVTNYIIRTQPNARGKILVTERLEPPNPKCIVCRDDPEANVKLNMSTFTLKVLIRVQKKDFTFQCTIFKMFEEKILKGALNMVAPDAELSGENFCVQYYHLKLNLFRQRYHPYLK